MTTTMRTPTGPEDWCWSASWGWDSAALESVQPADGRTRSQARMRYARDVCEPYMDIVAWKRYARALDRQDLWEWWADQNGWMEEDPDGPDGAEREMPATPPEDWRPPYYDEGMPVWEICRPDADGAVAVWLVGMRGDRAPHLPRAKDNEERNDGR